ncbi:MAG: PAS domain-containing protein [Kiritimatiellia bacterium]
MDESFPNELPMDPRLAELLETNRALEKRVNQFSRVEQNLIRARDQLDRELVGLRAICNFSQTALGYEDLAWVYALCVDAAVEAMDTECAVLFIQNPTSQTFDVAATCCLETRTVPIPSNQAWEDMYAEQIAEQKPFFANLPPAFQAVLNPSTDRMIIMPMANRDASLRGFIATGVSCDKAPFFPALSDDRLTTAEVFLKQMLVIEDVSLQRADRMRAEQESRENAARFRSLFTDAPIALVEADLSVVKRWLNIRVLRKGLEPESFLRENPAAIHACMLLIRVVDVNHQAVELYQAKSREDLINNIEAVLIHDSYAAFANFLINMLNHDNRPTLSRHHTLTGREIRVEITAAQSDHNTWKRVHLAVREIPAFLDSRVLPLDLPDRSLQG